MLKRNRTVTIAGMFLLLFFILVARLIQIQLVNTEAFSKYDVNLIETSVNQRIQSIVLDDGRGKFYDRNGKLINHVQIPTLLLFPFLKKMDWPVEKLSDIIDVPESQILSAVENEKQPFAFRLGKKPISLSESQIDQINELKIPGVFAANRMFPTETKVAQQLIGGLTSPSTRKSERYKELEAFSPKLQIGDKGLQQQFDDFLISIGESKLAYHVDGIGGPLFGINVKYLSPGNPLYPVKVLTTIDLELQETGEKTVDELGIVSGGLILIDIESSEIRALVSRPNVNPKDPNIDNGSKNLMFTQATLGSVFKTVVAAAAIEENIVNAQSKFNCNKQINGTPHIDSEKFQGVLNFTDSFAQSCNWTFGELSVNLSKINPNLLEEYSEKLQLIGGSGWKGNIYHSEITQLNSEETGQVWVKDEYKKDAKLVAQTGIGQQDVQASPLAVANMMATIARGGERRLVKAVRKVEYANGTTAAKFKDIEIRENKISNSTAKELQRLLKEVVRSPEGTASLLQQLPFSIAGKTGTAQTVKINEQQLYNKWFAGYFPVEKPKYAIAAVKLNVEDNDSSATKLVQAYLQKVHETEKIDFLER